MNTLTPRPTIGVPIEWHFPAPRSFALDNGISVLAFDLPGQLVVTATLLLDVPLCIEPPDLEGVATLALRCADEGTATHPGGAFAEAIEDQGATMGGTAKLWGTTLSLEAPATRLRPALALLAEAAREPAYAKDDVARQVALRLAEIDQVMVNPAACAAIGLRAAITSADSRLHRPSAGRAETVAHLCVDDLRAFHDHWWTPRGATLVVAGQLPDDLDTMLRDSLGAWAAPEPSPSAPEHTPTLDAPDAPGEVWLIDRPEAVQAVITIGTLTPTRRDAAWSPAQVGVCALGGSFGSRLNSVLREERGFTYGAGCGLSAARDRGVFSTRTSCRVEVAAEAASVTLGLLDVSATPFTEAEAADAVAYLVGVAPLNYDTADAVAAQAVALAEAGMPMSWIDEHNDLIRATTATAATEALAPWIEPQRLRTVVCGPAAALLGPLRAAGLDARVVDVAGNPL